MSGSSASMYALKPFFCEEAKPPIRQQQLEYFQTHRAVANSQTFQEAIRMEPSARRANSMLSGILALVGIPLAGGGISRLFPPILAFDFFLEAEDFIDIWDWLDCGCVASPSLSVSCSLGEAFLLPLVEAARRTAGIILEVARAKGGIRERRVKCRTDRCIQNANGHGLSPATLPHLAMTPPEQSERERQFSWII